MATTVHELLVVDEPDAVPRARRFVASALADAPVDLRDDAELVATELVTNALLHGTPPVSMRVHWHDGVVRIEVQDANRLAPVRMRPSNGGMTGRGLGLVAALSRAWGSQPIDAGKVVWAELAAGSQPTADDPSLDIDAFLAGWEDEPDDEPRFTVELGAVPTDLLLDAKGHIDNLVREFTLLASGAAAGEARALPEQVVDLVQTVVHGFADARAQIKQQALAAAARGAVDTDLRLVLPVSAADAGERYLAALDEADRQARAARLLTLETPAVHRVFRQWYVQSLVNQLRSVAVGERPRPAPTFLQRLAAEVTELAPLRELASRLAVLQGVTARLTGAASVDEVVEEVCASAHDVLGALTARIYLLASDGMLRSVATAGELDPLAQHYAEFPAAADLPGGLALRSGAPVVVRSVGELVERFPTLAGIYPDERTLVVAPLVVRGHELGVLSLSFRGQGAVDETTQLAFLTTIADVTAQALERASVALQAERASQRLAFLAEASVLLSSSLDYRGVLEAVAGLIVPRLADWCVIQLVDNEGLNTVALAHADPEKVQWAREMALRYPPDPQATTGAANVVRTGRSEFYPVIPEELLTATATDDHHLQLIRQLGLSSGLVVPLTGRSGVIGAVTMVYAESERRYTEDDITFAEDLARRAALAVENAHAFRVQSGRLAEVMRVAEAAQHAILSPPPPQIGPVALAARYVSAAAEALIGGDLYEVVERTGAVRLLIGDVRGKGLEAVRLATVVLGEFRAAAADIDDLADVAVQIDRRLRRYLGQEDFVTALLAEISDDGRFTIANCGHPPALLASGGAVSEVSTPPSLPLGLGAVPEVVHGQMRPGDRLMLYTDGIIEARDAERRFVDLHEVTSALGGGALDTVLDLVLAALTDAVGSALGDDLALVVAEYRGLSAVTP